MPVITSVGALMVLVFCAVMIGAWVSTGPERISYCGVQIALAFLLTTLNGFGPSFEFSQAGGRIMGILLGIVVIYVIFTQFWPASIVGEIRETLGDAVARLQRLSGKPADERLAETEESAAVLRIVQDMKEKLSMASFEPRRERASAETLARYDAIRQEVETPWREIRFSRDVPRSTTLRLAEIDRDLGATA